MRELVLRVHRPGRVSWRGAWEAQKRLALRVSSDRHVAHLILVEHPPVYTLGRNARRENVLLPREELASRGFAVEETDRGGDVTYHGPGQVTGYPVLHLPTWSLTVKDHVHGMEEAMKRACASFGVEAATRAGMIGVWAAGGKIGAIGIHVSRGIATHGFALNACPDLLAYALIHPCGMPGAPATSLETEAKKKVSWAEASAAMEREMTSVLGPDRVEASPL